MFLNLRVNVLAMPTRTVVYDHQTFTLQRFGGISRYFCELASRVNKAPGFGAKVVAPIHFNDYLLHSDVPKFGVNLRPLHPRLGPIYRAGCRILAPMVTHAARPSIVHHTYYSESYAPSSVPTVVTVFDMIHEILPHEFPPRDPTSHAKRLSVERADLVLCISSSTASDLMRLFKVPERKIRITYLGLSDTFAHASPEHAAPHPRPYVLFVGHRGGYKNFAGAIKAYASSSRLRQSFDFVVFGGFAIGREEQALIDSLGLRPDTVRRLTGSDAELASAYRHARAFVYPSRYEGFGIPPLEAMASACPVVCSNVSSIPEVVGTAAEMFDPNDSEDIAAALERVCFDGARREALIAAGFERLSHFSWDRCADKTVQAYRSLLGDTST
jgi:glycosyltransferase involved in cell wall biosynthesis